MGHTSAKHESYMCHVCVIPVLDKLLHWAESVILYWFLLQQPCLMTVCLSAYLMTVQTHYPYVHS